MKPTITYTAAMAASRDAGDRSMREGNRSVWARKDWEVACATFERLYGPVQRGNRWSDGHATAAPRPT